jgi:hypothetical protein
MGSYMQAASEQAAYRAWANGQVIPDRITLALDEQALYGPEVDAACGVEEPAVDMWEAGTLYPTWDQLCALARLVNRPVHLFTMVPGATIITEGFICGENTGGRFIRHPIVEYTAEAIAAANLPKVPPPPPPPLPPTGRRRLRQVA